MADLLWGFLVVCVVAFGTFGLTLSLSRRVPRYVSDLLALSVVALIFAYIRFVWYQTRLVDLLPYSNVVILGNWFPIAAGSLGGFAWHRIPGRIWRKSLFVGSLSAASVYSMIWPLVGQIPHCMDVWQNGICVQTTSKTCTPACAATLLQTHGIEATEGEMAQLCLTREGTTWMGLYRGLKLKTSGTEWDVEVLSGDTRDLLANIDSPVILSVGLPSRSLHSQHVSNEWGWKNGIGHSVILMRRSIRNRVLIADPTPDVGWEDWTSEELRFLYRGTAMRLVKRT